MRGARVHVVHAQGALHGCPAAAGGKQDSFLSPAALHLLSEAAAALRLQHTPHL
jgi:hypothetical protein